MPTIIPLQPWMGGSWADGPPPPEPEPEPSPAGALGRTVGLSVAMSVKKQDTPKPTFGVR